MPRLCRGDRDSERQVEVGGVLDTVDQEGRDGRRPRPALDRVSTARPTTFCPSARPTTTQAHRRRGRDDLRAQVLMGIPSDRRFLRAARRQLGHLLPVASQSGRAAQETSSPGRDDRVARWGVCRALARIARRSRPARLHPPVECGRSLETTRPRRSVESAGYGYCKSHSRLFWGCAHLACSPDGTPRAAALVGADRPEREVALRILPRALRGGQTVVCDKAYAGREFAAPCRAARPHVVAAGASQRAPTTACTWRRFASASSRSSAPARTLLSLERHGAHHPAQPVRADRYPLAHNGSVHQPQPRRLGRPSRRSPTSPRNRGINHLVEGVTRRARRD